MELPSAPLEASELAKNYGVLPLIAQLEKIHFCPTVPPRTLSMTLYCYVIPMFLPLSLSVSEKKKGKSRITNTSFCVHPCYIGALILGYGVVLPPPGTSFLT